MRKNNGKSQSNLNTRLPHLTTLLPPQTSEQLRQSQAECRRLEGELALSQLALSTATTSASTAQVYSICETQRQRYIQRIIRTRNCITPRGRSWPSEHPTQAQILAEQQAASVREADTSRQLQSSNEALVRQLGGIPKNECRHECFSGKVNLTQLFHLTEILEYQAQSEQFDNWRLTL